MQRSVSPILHDYKPNAGQTNLKTRRLPWFAAGLGLPLLALGALVNLQDAADSLQPLAPTESISTPLQRQGFANFPEPDASLAPLSAVADNSQAQAEAADPALLMPATQHTSLNLTIKSGDTLDRLFRKHDLNLGDLAAIVKIPEAAKHVRLLMPGDSFEIQHDDGRIVSIYRELNLTSALSITKDESDKLGYVAATIPRPVDYQEQLAYGRIENSLFESALGTGMSDKVIMNLAGIFAWDVDFVYDIRKGDDYYILYEKIYQGENHVADGDIIAAEFNNNGRVFQAIRYVDAEGRADYYTADGHSVRKAFVRAPVDFARISSSFNPRRRHPILNTIRAHRGVDYSAKSGTPIKAAGDGKVIFRGRKNGYGNVVILQHGGNITTLYAHMSQFAKSARLSKRVRQGQVIGYVGKTGLATAPHLHYEYRLNGVHRNPRTVKLPQAQPIKDEFKQDFLTASAPVLARLSLYKRTQVASVGP